MVGLQILSTWGISCFRDRDCKFVIEGFNLKMSNGSWNSAHTNFIGVNYDKCISKLAAYNVWDVIMVYCSTLSKIYCSKAVDRGWSRWHVHPGIQLQHDGQSEAIWGPHWLYTQCCSPPNIALCSFLLWWHAYQAVGLGERLDMCPDFWRTFSLCHASVL